MSHSLNQGKEIVPRNQHVWSTACLQHVAMQGGKIIIPPQIILGIIISNGKKKSPSVHGQCERKGT